MSKNLTRKGLAFGAVVALGSSLFTGAPALADNNGPITLLPDGGAVASATFNSIIGAGITLSAALDPGEATQTAATDDEVRRYIVTNNGGAAITLTTTGTLITAGYLLYDPATGGTVADVTAGDADYASSTTMSAVDFNCGTVSAPVACTADNLGGHDATKPYVNYEAGVIVTNAKKILIAAAVEGGGADDSFATLKVDSSSTSTVTVTVQAIADTDTANALNTTGKVGPFENASAIETVTLYPISAVSATTTIETLARGASAFAAKIVYGSSINPFAVDAATYATLFKDGVAVSLDEDGTPSASDNVEKVVADTAAASTGKIVVDGSNEDDASSAAVVNWAAGIYSAQAYFKKGSDYIAVGAASAVVDLSNGLIANVTTTDATVTETSNIDESSDTVTVRTGTETLVVSAKTLDNAGTPATIEKAGLRYKATVTAVALDEDSSVVVSGTTSKLAETDDVVVAYAISNSTGKVSFTLTNVGASAGDKVTVDVQTLNAVGVWITADTITATWANAALSSFSAVPGNYISGANPTLTFKAKDQFGAPVSATATGALSVNVVAKVGGIEKKALLSETKSVVNGEASFTFANFATAAIPGQVQATLFEGVTKSSVAAPAGTTAGVITVNVYNTSDTATITVLDAYATNVTYKDYVVGDESAAAVAAALTLTGLSGSDGIAISGSIQNATAVGQPGSVVTVAADGVLFYDSAQGIYAEDSIVIYTNEFGAYSVVAIAHELNTVGHTVTITSGGKTASTLLKTYLPKDVLTANNLAFSWNLPAELVVNTTYAVTVTLTDKWGNPVATPGANSVAVEGNGSVLVNGVTGATNKKFDKNGQAVVFVRSLKDIAGPGAITATLSPAASQYALDPSINGVTSADGSGSLGFDSFGSLVAITTDVTSTVWNETLFRDALEAIVDVKDSATAPAATGKVNVGSFNGKLVVYALGLDGAKISWKVAGKWGVANASGDALNRFDRPVGDSGVNVLVDIYVNGVKQLSKSVLTR